MTPEAIKATETVKKLLNLAANSAATEAEAASATEKAMALLAAHNIELASLETKPGSRSDKKFKGGLYPWQRIIWNAVAKLNFCVYWTISGADKGSKFEHRLLGSHVNVTATQVMCDYLCDTTDRLGKEWAANAGVHMFSKSTNSFKEGIAERLQTRLSIIGHQRKMDAEQQKRDQAAQHSTGTSITLFDVYKTEKAANDDYLYGEGYTARRMQEEAERDARYAAWKIEREQWIRDNPEAYAKEQADIDEAYAKAKAKEAKRKPPRERVVRYKGDAYARDAGYRKGGDIGLDPQVGRNNTPKLGN